MTTLALLLAVILGTLLSVVLGGAVALGVCKACGQ
jgi:hypothetical protein